MTKRLAGRSALITAAVRGPERARAVRGTTDIEAAESSAAHADDGVKIDTLCAKGENLPLGEETRGGGMPAPIRRGTVPAIPAGVAVLPAFATRASTFARTCNDVGGNWKS